MIVTFCSGVYPTIDRNTIFSCEVIAHADTAKQNCIYNFAWQYLQGLPYFFCLFLCEVLVLFHCIKERFVKFVAPAVFAIADLKCFVN